MMAITRIQIALLVGIVLGAAGGVGACMAVRISRAPAATDCQISDMDRTILGHGPNGETFKRRPVEITEGKRY